MATSAVTMQAQKFALVDMEYILKNIPAYERANEQLNQVSKQWQAEVNRPVRMPSWRKRSRLQT